MAEIERETRERLDGSRFMKQVLYGSRGLRRIHSVGVAALARQLGLSVPHVSQVLSGQRTSRRVTEAAKAGGVVVVAELEARP